MTWSQGAAWSPLATPAFGPEVVPHRTLSRSLGQNVCVDVGVGVGVGVYGRCHQLQRLDPRPCRTGLSLVLLGRSWAGGGALRPRLVACRAPASSALPANGRPQAGASAPMTTIAA
jgi:hypothetical protein